MVDNNQSREKNKMENKKTQSMKEQKEQEKFEMLCDIRYRKPRLNSQGIDCICLEDKSDYQGDRSLIDRLQEFGSHVAYGISISYAKPIRDMTGQGNYTYEAQHGEDKYTVKVQKVGSKRKYGEWGIDCFGDFVIELFDDRGETYAGTPIGVRHFSESATKFAYNYALDLAQELSKEHNMPLVDDTKPGRKKAMSEYKKKK
jgi:hypothetical protein